MEKPAADQATSNELSNWHFYLYTVVILWGWEMCVGEARIENLGNKLENESSLLEQRLKERIKRALIPL